MNDFLRYRVLMVLWLIMSAGVNVSKGIDEKGIEVLIKTNQDLRLKLRRYVLEKTIFTRTNIPNKGSICSKLHKQFRSEMDLTLWTEGDLREFKDCIGLLKYAANDLEEKSKGNIITKLSRAVVNFDWDEVLEDFKESALFLRERAQFAEEEIDRALAKKNEI
jgi:hypothetical protein